MFRKLPPVLIALVALALLASACGPATPNGGTTTPTPQKGGMITFGLIGDPVVLNPVLSTDVPSGSINSRVYNGLVRTNEKLELVGDLADKWDFSADGLTWTFHLKKNVFWHDGQQFTAADVKFTYETIKSPDYTGVRTNDLKFITEIEAPDDFTVKIHLDKPYAPLLSKLTLGIIPKHIFETVPVAQMEESQANLKPVGTGPYKLAEWQRGQVVSLEANARYFGEGPYIDKVVYRVYQNDQAMLAALEKGEIDYMGTIPADDLERVTKSLADRYEFTPIPQNGYTYIGLKQTDPVLGDKAVRQALMYAANREQVVEDVLKGYGDVMNSNIPKASWAYAGDQLNEYKFDPEKAKQLLDQAGWKPGSDGLRAKDGQKLTFKLLTSTGNKTLESALVIVQKNWKDIGVDCQVEYLEWPVLVSQYLDMAQFQSYALAWSLGIDPDFYLYFHSSAAVDDQGQLVGFNDVEFKDSRLDHLLEQGRAELDQDKRKQIYIEAQKIVNDELPYVFLYANNAPVAMSKRIQGVTWSPTGPIFPEKWWVKQ